MQRHRAGRVAVLLSLNKVDSRPDGVERTTGTIVPNSRQPTGVSKSPSRSPAKRLAQKRPSVVGLMEHTPSENSMEDTSSEEMETGGVRAKEPRAARANGVMVEADSGLEMNMDLADAGSILNGSCTPSEMQDYADERDPPGSAVADTKACPVEGHSHGHEKCCPDEAYDCVFYKGDVHRTKWEEAAIYVKEGEDNEKFNYHPKGRWSKLIFKLLHHPAYYITHLIVTILLMLLALSEDYPVPRGHQISDKAKLIILIVDTVLEFFCLGFIAVYIILKFIWFGPRQFITSKTTVINAIVLVVMFIEAVAVLARRESHLRVTRALRPLFIIDNFLMDGLRRELRDILKSLKPIIDVLFLLLFIIFVFSLVGYYIFAEVDPSYFDSFKKSFVSLFVLMTTSNNPDVLLESYYEHPGSVIYFYLYLIITVYFITNVLLAVVYTSFSDAEMLKFKKIYLHKRKALHLAFNILSGGTEGITFHDFLPFVQHYRPRLTDFEVMCIFKSLHKDTEHAEEHESITREEFYNFYEVQDLKWKQVRSDGKQGKVPWYEQVHISRACQLPLKVCHKMVKSKPFNAVVYLIVLINVLAFVVYALAVDDCPPEERFMKLKQVYPASVLFTIFYCSEIIIKIIGYGPHIYYRKAWNVIDTLIVIVSVVCLLLEINQKLIFLSLMRPIKLLRLLRLKRKYRDIMSTIVYLAPKMLTVAAFLVIVHYFFAIIGIEFFKGKVYKGCCNESWYGVVTYYTGNISENATDNVNPAPDNYYLFNFDDICRSYATLFTLMIVNNWHIIMEAYASEVEPRWLVRLYFLSFNIITLVIFEVVISFIVEAFVFKILTRQRSRICPTHHKPYYFCNCARTYNNKKKVKVTLVQADLEEIKTEHGNMTQTHSALFTSLSQLKLWRPGSANHETNKTYVGRRLKTKDDIQLQMYRPLIREWVADAERRVQEEADGSNCTQESLKETIFKRARHLYEYITD